MKQLMLYAFLIVAAATIYLKKPQTARLGAAVEPAVANPAQKMSETLVPTFTEEESEAAPSPEETHLDSVVESIDPMQPYDFTRAVKELRRLPAEQVSQFFITRLRHTAPPHAFERDRLVMLANAMQLPTDLPFWEDLAFRQTPRYDKESELRNPKHPTLESRFIDVEQLQAIRNIGILARDHRPARQALMEIILNPDPSVHRTLHRQEAYTALKESDLAASLRVLKQLPEDDDLLKRLREFRL